LQDVASAMDVPVREWCRISGLLLKL
jgi:hypothetical protein